MRLLRRAAIGGAVVLLGLLMPTPAHAATADDVEAALASKINRGRSGHERAALVTHFGLQAIAGDWSEQMAATNRFTHGDPGGRVDSAAPDPPEPNGAPDDGFVSWCENIAWNSLAQGSSADEVAQMFYDQWFRSRPHKECMLSLGHRDFGQTVMGVGIVYDSSDGRWWATLDVARDTTPPSPGSWRRYEQSAGGVTYSGPWANGSSSAASRGSYRRSDTRGALARFVFTGRGVRWIGIRTARGGYAEVRLDGVLIATVNQYARRTAYGAKLFERTGLANARHTLEIRVKGTKFSRSTGYRTWVDAFERFA